MARITDNFNRASLGANWTQQDNGGFGSIIVDSSTVVCGSSAQPDATRQFAYYSATAPDTNNQENEITVAGLSFLNDSFSIGVTCRASGTTNATRSCYEAVVKATASNGNPQTVDLNKWVNGTRTNLATGSITISNGGKLKVRASGTTIEALVDGVVVLSATDSALTSGFIGVSGAGGGLTSSAPYGDNMDGGDLAVAAPEDSTRRQHKKIARPGRGPYSKGRYKRPSLDVLPQTLWADGGTEPVTSTDSADANAAFTAAATDSVTPTDSADRSGDVISAASDAANATDSADAIGVFVRDATDAATAIDAATSDQKPHVTDRTGTAAPRPGRTPYSVGRLFRPRLDVFNNTFPTTGNDSVSAADASSTNIVGVAAAADAAAPADSATQAGVFGASASDSISINDVAASTAAGDRESIDAVNAIDSADAIIVGTAIAAQAHALADTADSSLFGNNLIASESFAAAAVSDAAGSVYVSSAAEAHLLAALASAVKVGVFEPTANSRVRVDSKARVAKGRIGGRRI